MIISLFIKIQLSNRIDDELYSSVCQSAEYNRSTNDVTEREPLFIFFNLLYLFPALKFEKMSTEATLYSNASVKVWDEDRSNQDVPRNVIVKMQLDLPGIRGSVSCIYSMVYQEECQGSIDKGDAFFTFTDQVQGENKDGEQGSMITHGKGSFKAATFQVNGEFEIVQGTQQGSFRDLFKSGGKGSFKTNEENPHTIDYSFYSA